MLATFKVRKYFLVVSLAIRVISVVWLDSHLPSAPSDFFAANFVLRISQFRAVQSCFAHLVFAIFSASAIIRELWVALHLPLIMSQCCGLVLSWVALQMLLMPDCSVYFAFTTSVHNATRRAWMKICSATVSLSTGSNAVGDAFWSNLFRDDTVSCTSVIRLLPM